VIDKYYAADIAPVLDIDSKTVWRTVRQHSIIPEMVGNKYAITLAQVEKLECATGVSIPRKQKPKPKVQRPQRIPRTLTAKEKAIAPTPKFTLTAECKVSQAELQRNRERIAAVEAMVRDGKVEPRVEPAGAVVPQPWRWRGSL
jgi:hypothetical protein